MSPDSRLPLPRRRATSIQQPVHRRPFYGKTTKTFDTYINRPSNIRAPLADHGMDNFSYDPDHLHAYKMPTELEQSLPDELLGQSQLWQLAAAALETSLERIGKLYQAAELHAYPVMPHPSRIRSVSEVTSSLTEASSPSYMATSPPSTITSPSNSLEKVSFLQLNQASLGMESPPMTPADSVGSITPCIASDEIKIHSGFRVLERINSELSALTMTESAGSGARSPDFDPISWEMYVRKYEYHLQDVKEARKRMLGYGRKINTLCKELALDTGDIIMPNVSEFIKWWGPMERICSEELQPRIDRLQVPDHDQIRAK